MLVFSKKEPVYQLTGLSILLTILLFVATKGKAYYITGLLPFLVAAGSYFAEKMVKQKIILFAGLTILTGWSLLSFPFVIPTLSFEKLENYSAKTKGWVAALFMRWEDGNEYTVSQVYADMTGWQEMADLAGKAFNQLTEEEKKRCIIFCERNYGYAGAIHFYGKKYKLPQPITYHESYIFWAPKSIPWGPAIYINYEPRGMKEIFGDVTEIGVVNNPYFREKGVKVFLCRNPKPEITEVYKADLRKERERFKKKK